MAAALPGKKFGRDRMAKKDPGNRRKTRSLREEDLYDPVKAFLTAQGYEVKGELGGCDLLAIRGKEPPIIIELKTTFNLELVLQGVDRQKITDVVYLAVAAPKATSRGSVWYRRYNDIIRLCRLLGFGLLNVHINSRRPSWVEPLLDPAPYKPRKNKARRDILLKEFAHRIGDPNRGGANKRPVVTAYRQDVLRCASTIQQHGALKASRVKELSSVENAARMLLRDYYGWFERVERGIYDLSLKGRAAVEEYADVVRELG